MKSASKILLDARRTWARLERRDAEVDSFSRPSSCRVRWATASSQSRPRGSEQVKATTQLRPNLVSDRARRISLSAASCPYTPRDVHANTTFQTAALTRMEPIYRIRLLATTFDVLWAHQRLYSHQKLPDPSSANKALARVATYHCHSTRVNVRRNVHHQLVDNAANGQAVRLGLRYS